MIDNRDEILSELKTVAASFDVLIKNVAVSGKSGEILHEIRRVKQQLNQLNAKLDGSHKNDKTSINIKENSIKK